VRPKKGKRGIHPPREQTLRNDIGFTHYLLVAAGIASVPSSAYDLSPFFRISTATSEDVLTDVMDRLAEYTAKQRRN